ncbi:hypothetical protein CCACVL1_25442, partial [Corchorus capsularis]
SIVEKNIRSIEITGGVFKPHSQVIQATEITGGVVKPHSQVIQPLR